MGRIVANVMLYVLAALAVLYLGDWAVWKIRAANGGGVGTVTVARLQVASETGNKEEYFADGSEDVQCSKSLFPQTGAGACWWVEQHKTVYER
jgi:hypothetical protein